MTHSYLVVALASCLVLPLGGCQKGPASTSSAQGIASDAAQTVPVVKAVPRTAGTGLPSYSRDPIEALDGFASAIEARDWKAVRRYWGDNGAGSGLDDAAFAHKWGTLASPQVSVGTGRQEGAAGSLFYSAPVTIVDGKRTIHGGITIRRVNDVDGATADQLRWHIESTTLEF